MLHCLFQDRKKKSSFFFCFEKKGKILIIINVSRNYFILFYLDLTGVSLDTDAIVDQSKWIDLVDIKPRPDRVSLESSSFKNPLLGGKANDKIIFFDSSLNNLYIYAFDTTSKQWETKQDKV